MTDYTEAATRPTKTTNPATQLARRALWAALEDDMPGCPYGVKPLHVTDRYDRGIWTADILADGDPRHVVRVEYNGGSWCVHTDGQPWATAYTQRDAEHQVVADLTYQSHLIALPKPKH